MAMKANASAQGSANFKKYVGIASFRIMGVNPTKEENEKFFGREMQEEPVYLTNKQDDSGNSYKTLRVTFLLQADKQYEDGKEIDTNAALEEPLKTSVSFFIDSRYYYNKDKTKVQVIDKYGRTAWPTIEQAKNHQIPVYANGPAKIASDYRPAYRGEDELVTFIRNYLNVTPIDRYNSNTGEWITNANPEDCEGSIEHIQDYFKGDISELKEYCNLMPSNRVKLLVGVRTDDQGKQFLTVYSRLSAGNGARSYTRFKDEIESNKEYLKDTVFTTDPTGTISDLKEYNEDVKATNLSAPANDPFAAASPSGADDLPFGNPDDPFA